MVLEAVQNVEHKHEYLPVYWSPILGGVFECRCGMPQYRPKMTKARFEKVKKTYAKKRT